jgi:hypothetical protein
MKYAFLVYADPARLGEVNDAECLAFSEEIVASGNRLGGEALEPIETATTVRIRNGKPAITDGPFAETKEHLAGFYLIEARDMNEAIRIASRVPPVRVGSIEIRPVRQLDGSGHIGIEQALTANTSR